MAYNFERLLYFETNNLETSLIVSDGGRVDNSNITTSYPDEDGLFLSDDSAATTTSSLTITDRLVDGDPTEDVSPTIVITDTNWSIGIDLSSPASVTKFLLFDDGTAGPGIRQLEDDGNSLQLYASNTGTTWVLQQTFKPLNRFKYSHFGVHGIPIVLKEALGYRYFKFYANNGALKSADGTLLQMTQIQAFITNDLNEFGKVMNKNYKVTIIENEASTPQTVGGRDGVVNINSAPEGFKQ